MTFSDLREQSLPVDANASISPQHIASLMKQVYEAADLYNAVRGVHTSALSDGETLILVAQDIGRHNTLDRLWGQALQQGIETRGLVLIASGRISSEMMGKAARMQVPIVISRTSPTSLSTALAKAWNITTIGYARGHNFRIYSGDERVVGTEASLLAENPDLALPERPRLLSDDLAFLLPRAPNTLHPDSCQPVNFTILHVVYGASY